MNKLKVGATILLALSTATTLMAQTMEKAIDSVRPALVRIFVIESSFEQGRESLDQVAGSGVILTPDGYVVTNHHVAGWAKRIFCTLSNKQRVEADLIGTDPMTDISVLKLRVGSQPYSFAKWGDSSKLKVGDTVYAMGSPLALSQSVTRGVVSNTELTMPDFGGQQQMTLDGEDVGSMVLWIGHDAKISPGNSGGPLVNAEGEVVGINEIEFGLGGAIPSNIANEVSQQIIKNREVKRAFLGITVQPLLPSQVGDKGILVSDVLQGSPADKAGVKSGDMITQIGDKEVSVRYSEQLPAYNRLVAELPIGQAVTIKVVQEGVEKTVSVTPKDRKSAFTKPREFKAWGMCLTNVTDLDAQDLHRPNTDGVLVYSVSPGKAAGTAKPTIAMDDIITQVNGRPVKNLEEFEVITRDLVSKGKPTPVLVGLERDGEMLVTVATIGSREVEDKGLETRKPSLGIGTQVLSPEIAKALGVEGRSGFRVTRVTKGSSAFLAGLKVGDLMFSVDGIHLEASQPEDGEELTELIRQYDIGSTVKVAIQRGAEKKVISVKLTEPDPTARDMDKYRDPNFEFTARDLTSKDRAQRDLDPKAKGVCVDEVSTGGWAALGKLRAGDVILSINGKEVINVKLLKQELKDIAQAKTKVVVLKVLRRDGISYVEVEADWSGGN